MNQTFSGTTLLGFIVLFAVLLFIIAFIKKPKVANLKQKQSTLGRSWTERSAKNKFKNQTKTKTKINNKPSVFSSAPKSQLLKLKTIISQNFPDFNATVREHHLVLERNAKKVAMLTLDAGTALGRRRLGEVSVINFHKLPSVEELRIELSGV